MDTFAAIALATEAPSTAILKGQPTKIDDNILTSVMWRSVWTTSFYQIAILLGLFFWAPHYWPLVYTAEDNFMNSENSEAKKQHYTLVFTAFIFMQIFNSFNCRKISIHEINIFSQVFNNLYFYVVLILEVAITIVMIEYLGKFVQAGSLTTEMYMICLGIGLSSWIFAAFIKCTPARWVDKYNANIDESMKVADDDPMIRTFKRATGQKTREPKDRLLDNKVANV